MFANYEELVDMIVTKINHSVFKQGIVTHKLGTLHLDKKSSFSLP